RGDNPLHICRSMCWKRISMIMAHVVRRDNFICNRKVAAAPKLLAPAPRRSFVLFGQHVSSFCGVPVYCLVERRLPHASGKCGCRDRYCSQCLRVIHVVILQADYRISTIHLQEGSRMPSKHESKSIPASIFAVLRAYLAARGSFSEDDF